MPTVKLVITKQFTFRGVPERFSNGYLFQTGSTNVDNATLSAGCAALITMERAIHGSHITFPYALGGLLGEDALYVEEFGTPLAGQLAPSSDHQEVCVMMESKFGQRRYMRKWYHPGARVGGTGATADQLQGGTKTLFDTTCTKLTDGTMPQGWRYCRPNGALATVPFTADQWVRTHQLKARGKRP